ncbi:NAD-dependent epimerase/dehydratase family protein [Enterococcus lemanii]|uniref:NAD-dependent epimerase/dehydratase family protein n=1 Tax=Enterococcus lemanii TaxID=1159752 RepID=A0ABV9MV58_9ENTE|nr:UDP-glucose 4-epimerase [Enterococcus lemanii]
MKKILITGANSFIGTSFESYMKQFGSEYQIDTLNMREPSWIEYDFSEYDMVFHVAGIAHADVSKVSEDTKKLYYQVNRDLAIETANKYKESRADKKSQFIYMSSIIIYGEETNIHKKRIITPATLPSPSNFYGDSKLQAEKGLLPLESEAFKIAIIRPPMIYGEGSKGNYQQLVKLAKKLPVFPDIKNERSMLHINRLSQFIKELIDLQDGGIYFPQDPEYVRTSRMVKKIAEDNGKKIHLFSSLNWAVYLMGYIPGKFGKLVNKAFGNLVYDVKED